MTDPLATINTRQTPQMQQAHPDQIKNSEGGYTFKADDLSRLRRFLATGAEGGTFYASQQEVALDASTLVLDLIRAGRGTEVLATVVDMSERGATVRQQPLMFTMAALSGAEDEEVRKATLAALPRVARTASHLFLFASYVENFRGWGKGLRKAVARWYDGQDVNRLAYQIEKYGQRYGFAHRDLLLLGHVGSRQTLGLPKGTPLSAAYGEETDARLALYEHAAGKAVEAARLPYTSVQASLLAAAETPDDTLAVIAESQSVSWEMVKSEHLGDLRVWQALLDGGHVPVGALIKNLGRLTANGALDPFGMDDRTSRVIGRLIDSQVLAKGRVHPMTVLLAAATYRMGRGLQGSLTWHPIPNIERALDTAFMAAMPGIEPITDKTAMIGVDTSGSMDSGTVAGLPLTPRDAAMALGMSLAAQFPRNMGVAFTAANAPGVVQSYAGTGRQWSDSGIVPMNLDPARRLVDLIAESQTLPMGRTDCSLPVLYAMERGLHVDAFVVLTDNETYAGKMHPHQALRQYRERTGIPARMVTVSMTYNHSTISDPSDPLMLDVVGLDSNAVSLVGDFIAGRV